MVIRSTLIGHASVLCEVEGTTLLMDPNLFSAFREDAFGFFPPRRCDVTRMPSPDVILISHRHRDHFDLRSLNELPRESLVVHPADPLIAHALDRLGFSRRRVAAEWDHIGISADVTVVATPSLMSRVGSGELGYLVRAGGRSVWNLADSVLSPADICVLRSVAGDVDVAFFPYQPMLQSEFVQNRSNAFPFEEYGAVLRRAKTIKPRVLIPSSCGYALKGANAWLNRFKFPVSRERFARDLRQVAPEIDVFILDPGDVVEIPAFGIPSVEVQSATSGFVRLVGGSEFNTDFNPTSEVMPLTEPGSPADAHEIRRKVDDLFSQWAHHFASMPDRWNLWHEWKLCYEFQIVISGEVERTWIDFSSKPARVGPPGQSPADFFLCCTASVLLGLADGRLHADHQLAGAIRTFSCFYRTTAYGIAGRRELLPEYSEERLGGFGLLRLLIDPDGQHEKRVMDYQLDRLLAEGRPHAARAVRH